MQEAPGSWNYASLLCGKSEETRRRHHRNTFTEITRVVTHFVFNSKPSAVDVRDTWHPWPLKPVPDPRGRWIPRTTVTMFIVVALTLAVICGSVFGLLMYRPVMLIRVAHGRQSAAGSILYFKTYPEGWKIDGNIILDLEIVNPSYFPLQVEIASCLLTLVPMWSGSIDDNFIVSSMTPVSSLALPVTAQSTNVFTYMALLSDWTDGMPPNLEPEFGSVWWQCRLGSLLFEAYLSEIVHYTMGGRAGEQTARSFPFTVPCVEVDFPPTKKKHFNHTTPTQPCCSSP